MLANIGVIAGIVLLAVEIRQNTVAVELAAANNSINSVQLNTNLLVADGELAAIIEKALLGNKLAGAEAIRANAYFANTLRGWQVLYYQQKDAVLRQELWNTARVEMQMIVGADYGLYEFWIDNRGRYSDEFNGFLMSLRDSR